MDEMISGKTGIATLAAEHDPSQAPPDHMDGEQLDLLPLKQAKGHATGAENGVSATRGRGRPAGSPNKSTEAWRNYILSKYPSPLEGLASIAFRPTLELAQELLANSGASANAKPSYDRLVELLKVQAGAMSQLIPYLHQKMPQAVDLGEGGLIQLVIGKVEGGEKTVETSEDLGFEFIDLESE